MIDEHAASDEFAAGRELEPVQYTFTPDKLTWYGHGTEDFHPWYFYQMEDSPFGAPIAHPTMCHVLKLACWAGQSGAVAADSRPHTEGPARMHVGYEAEYFDPPRVGETVTVRAKCLGEYVKRGRRYVEFEFLSYGEDGRPIARYKDTQLQATAKEGE